MNRADEAAGRYPPNGSCASSQHTADNLTRQPYFEGRTYRISGELTNTDKVMNDTFWIGVYPGLNEEMLSFIVEKIEAFFGVNS